MRFKQKIILASKSPRRKKLLKKIVKHFTIKVSSVKEEKIKAKSPEAFVLKAALAKAIDVALKTKASLVIGADTVVVLGNKILGKPSSKKQAKQMLKSLSGRMHKVITGLAVINSKTWVKVTDFETTKVKMKELSSQEINGYVGSGLPLDKAGAYGIQEIGQEFGITIDGDYDNVVGLPVGLLKSLLKDVNLK